MSVGTNGGPVVVTVVLSNGESSQKSVTIHGSIDALKQDLGFNASEYSLFLVSTDKSQTTKIKGKKELALIKEGSIIGVEKKKKLFSFSRSGKEDNENSKGKTVWWKRNKEPKEEKYQFTSHDNRDISSNENSRSVSREATPPESPSPLSTIETSVNNNNATNNSKERSNSNPNWVMTSEEKEAYRAAFNQVDNDEDGYITVNQAKEVFPGIESDVLTKIWSLSDVDEDRRLDADEYAIARFLINVKQQGETLPAILPDSFLASVNPMYLSFRKAVNLTEEEEDLEKLRSARGRSNAFYNMNSTSRRTSQFSNEIGLPEESSSALVNPTKEPKQNLDARVKSESRRFKIGYADTIGRRANMEDEIVVFGNFRGKEDEDFVAVFDGHGGRAAAEYAAKHLHRILAEKLSAMSSPEQCLKAAFLETNELMKKAKVEGGATALCALFIGENGYIANAGDSRAVLFDDGIAVRYSTDHKPDVPEEEKRIKDLGGTITTSTLSTGKVSSRLCGRLAVSRALGDFSFEPYISAEPQIQGPIKVPTHRKNFFLIMACDGLWDKLSDEDATRVAAPILDPEKAATKLRDVAYNEGSDDNISVVVIRFPPFE